MSGRYCLLQTACIGERNMCFAFLSLYSPLIITIFRMLPLFLMGGPELLNQDTNRPEKYQAPNHRIEQMQTGSRLTILR